MERILLLLLALCAIGVNANDCRNIEVTHWMQGNWQAKSTKSIITERWSLMADSSMNGTGATVALAGVTPFVEALKIITMAEEVYYLAKPPQNDVPVAFKLVECSAQYLKFANPAHDFPQTIEYKLHTQWDMEAVVSGGSKQFSINFRRQDDEGNNITQVKAYIQAYQRRELAAMLALTDEQIKWFSVYDDKLSVETNNRAELNTALKQHFARAKQSDPTLTAISAYGDFVAAIEKVSFQKAGKPHTSCSLSVYQFDGDLIKAVWYYPAQQCGSE